MDTIDFETVEVELAKIKGIADLLSSADEGITKETINVSGGMIYEFVKTIEAELAKEIGKSS